MTSASGEKVWNAGLSGPTIALFVCMGIVLLAIPFTVICILVCSGRVRHRKGPEDDEFSGHRLKRLKLRSLKQQQQQQQQNNTEPFKRANDKASILSRRRFSRSRIRSRISRPIDLPVRLSVLHPHPSTQPPTQQSLTSSSKSDAEPAPVSPVSEIASVAGQPPSPISSISPLAKPMPSHQPAQNSIEADQNISHSIFNHDLFMRVRPSSKRPSQVDLQFFDPESGRLSKEDLHQDRVDVGIARHEFERLGEDDEWKEARTETVDGILAPREWV